MAADRQPAPRGVDALMREFGRRFWFGMVRSRDGRSLTAVRKAGASEPGLYAVITPDADEMRDALEQDQLDGHAADPEPDDSG